VAGRRRTRFQVLEADFRWTGESRRFFYDFAAGGMFPQGLIPIRAIFR
jgi:hypothetical protein